MWECIYKTIKYVNCGWNKKWRWPSQLKISTFKLIKQLIKELLKTFSLNFSSLFFYQLLKLIYWPARIKIPSKYGRRFYPDPIGFLLRRTKENLSDQGIRVYVIRNKYYSTTLTLRNVFSPKNEGGEKFAWSTSKFFQPHGKKWKETSKVN